MHVRLHDILTYSYSIYRRLFVSSGFSKERTLIYASAVPHCKREYRTEAALNLRLTAFPMDLRQVIRQAAVGFLCRKWPISLRIIKMHKTELKRTETFN